MTVTDPTPGSTLTGRTALVTGTSRGIGRAIAVRLAREGAHVIAHHRGEASDVPSWTAEVRAAGGHVDHRYDLFRSEDQPALFGLHETWSGEDAIRHHAGTPHARRAQAVLRSILAEPFWTGFGVVVAGPSRAPQPSRDR